MNETLSFILLVIMVVGGIPVYLAVIYIALGWWLTKMEMRFQRKIERKAHEND